MDHHGVPVSDRDHVVVGNVERLAPGLKGLGIDHQGPEAVVSEDPSGDDRSTDK
jgi:hypothetical protein